MLQQQWAELIYVINCYKEFHLKRAMTAQLKVHIPSRSHDPCRDFQQLQAQRIYSVFL